MNITKTIISGQNPLADFFLSQTLADILQKHYTNCRDFVFFCIGTPKVAGDSLGPEIGSKLESLRFPHTFVYGTKDNPVHAQNLTAQWTLAKKRHPGSCFIAIDASFGPQSLLGNICIENSPLYPGRGVGKILPPVGHISITGILCTNSFRRHTNLQKISHDAVLSQASTIIHGIFQAMVFHHLTHQHCPSESDRIL